MKKIRLFTSIAVALIPAITACSQRQTLESEMRISELEEYSMQLELELNNVYAQLTGISRNLSAEVGNMEAALSDVHLKVADLPLGELIVTMREVEATVAVANQRAAALRVTANNLSQMTQY
ncbi:MAG: hypothetical protein LBG44_08780 [Gemmatimonadota bacterium]|nr:hypothetical protein [Gemmatimonadota bacterium]